MLISIPDVMLCKQQYGIPISRLLWLQVAVIQPYCGRQKQLYLQKTFSCNPLQLRLSACHMTLTSIRRGLAHLCYGLLCTQTGAKQWIQMNPQVEYIIKWVRTPFGTKMLSRYTKQGHVHRTKFFWMRRSCCWGSVCPPCGIDSVCSQFTSPWLMGD